MSTKQAGEAETPFKEDYIEEMKKNAALTAQIETLKAEKERLQGQVRRLSKQAQVESTPKDAQQEGNIVSGGPTASPATSPGSMATAATDHAHQPDGPKPHTDWFPPFCPDGNCDAKNLVWKDEAKCTNCGTRLGALEPIKAGKIGRCHNCGGTSYKPIKSVEELGYRIVP